MVLLGLLLIILGLVFSNVLFWLGVILLVVGAVANFTEVGGRRGRFW